MTDFNNGDYDPNPPFEFHPDMQWVSNFPKANFVKSLYTGEPEIKPDGNMPPAKPQPKLLFNQVPNVISYYPSSRYVINNLAPERSLSYNDVSAIAEARKQAEKTGVLKPEVAENLLPMAMVEGRTMNHGLGNLGFYASPQSIDRFKKMGFDVVDTTTPEYQDLKYTTRVEMGPNGPTINYYKERPDKDGKLVPFTGDLNAWKKGDIHIAYGPNGKDKFIYLNRFLRHQSKMNDYEYSAKLMAAVLAEKVAVSKTPEDAVSLYNGKGQVRDEEGKLWADADQYLRKVQEAKQMLNHPKNSQIKQYFDLYYK